MNQTNVGEVAGEHAALYTLWSASAEAMTMGRL